MPTRAADSVKAGPADAATGGTKEEPPVPVSKQYQQIAESMRLLQEDLVKEEERIYEVETRFIENQIGSGQIRWEAILDNTKSTLGDFATKLFEKARVATLSSSTSPHYDELVRAETDAAAAAARSRRRKAKKTSKKAGDD